MVLGKLILAIIAIAAFILAWRLLDVFLGLTFGILVWAIKAILFLVLLYVLYWLFARRHRLPSPE